MYIFSAQDSAWFSFHTDFGQVTYANISFFDANHSRILFHLSIRPDDKMVVCNSRGAAPGSWGQEEQIKIAVRSGARVECDFAPPQITIRIDGQKIAEWRPRLRRNRFPDLHKIARVDYQGGIAAVSVDMEESAARRLPLSLTRRLELRGHVPTPKAGARLRLEIPGIDMPPQLITSPQADGRTRLRAVLPGRIWDGVPPDGACECRLYLGDTLQTRLTLDRALLISQLNDVLSHDYPGTDLFLATQIVEHAKWAGIAPHLTSTARARLFGLAQFLGLEPDFGENISPAPPVSDDRAEAKVALQAALAQVASDLADGKTPDQLASALTPPAGSDAALFFCALAEPYCLHGAFDALYQQAASVLDLETEMAPRDHAWFTSGQLPYLLRMGRLDALKSALAQIAQARGEWIMTPPLGWVLQALARDPHLSPALRQDLVTQALLVLDKDAAEYWGRTACTALTRAGADLARALAHFPDPPALEARLLRLFGLMPDFWTALEGAALPPRLTLAQSAFTALSQGQPSAEDALGFFAQTGCADVDRIRRETRPATSPDRVQSALWLASDPTRPGSGDAVIRYLADPLLTEPADPALEKIAQAALPACYADIPQAPQAALQQQMGAHVTHLWSQPDLNPNPTLLTDLAALSHGGAHWIGVSLSLGLWQIAVQNGHAAWAEDLLQGVEQALKQGDAPQSASAALTMPLWSLTRLAQQDHAKATDALARLTAAGLSAPALSPGPAEPAFAPDHNPVFNTLITVFSCQAHLNSRIPQMRDGWLGQLAALGIPYLIVTGGGTGTRTKDILSLDAPDDYEGLPQKMLATIAWVHDHTTFTHMVKVDDDCFVHAREYAQSLSWLKFDYYGRILTRQRGQMDRTWHMAKSSRLRGRLEHDKSPEPSRYCDGGSGYALSRRAMAAALAAAQSSTGQALVQTSFMEDKLLGDLLSLQGIAPANEDYRISMRRREHPGGKIIPRWVNGFDASRTAPVKLVHLDDSTAQTAALDQAGKSGLRPAKIWPSFQPARLGEQSNALELVSTADKLATATTAPVAVVATMRNEMFMLPHFLAHYRALGVDSFLIADNCSDDGTLEYLADQPDVALFTVDTDYSRSHYGVAWQQALISRFRADRWTLVADADELLILPETADQTLASLLAQDAFAQAQAVRLFMLDLYPQGSLDSATFASGDPFAEAGFTDRSPFLQTSFGQGPFSNAPTWTSAVRHRLIPGSRNDLFVAQKIALLRYHPFMRLSAGLHYVANARLAKRDLLFGHFKYHADFFRKTQAEVARRQHFNDAEEYRAYLARISEGRSVIYDPTLSVPWRDCDFVKAQLAR